MKRIEDLVFTDDYMFGAVMHDPEICKKVLERILKINVDHVEYPELQKAIKPYYESKGVRLDVYVKDSDKVLDIEMQSSEPADVAKRTRYYQSMVDIDCLVRGKVYETLPKSYIIFFCLQDWLNTKLSIATFETYCNQNKNLKLKNECIITFLNANLWEKESDIETRAFLKYLIDKETTDELSNEIDDKVEQTKIDEIFRNDYLSMNLHEHDIRLEAKQETRLSNAKNAIKANIPLETVSQICELPLETVQKLADEIKNSK